MDFFHVKPGSIITYIGKNNPVFYGDYQVYLAEETFALGISVPEKEKGKKVIVALKSNYTPIFLDINFLSPADWELKM